MNGALNMKCNAFLRLRHRPRAHLHSPRDQARGEFIRAGLLNVCTVAYVTHLPGKLTESRSKSEAA